MREKKSILTLSAAATLTTVEPPSLSSQEGSAMSSWLHSDTMVTRLNGLVAKGLLRPLTSA